MVKEGSKGVRGTYKVKEIIFCLKNILNRSAIKKNIWSAEVLPFSAEITHHTTDLYNLFQKQLIRSHIAAYLLFNRNSYSSDNVLKKAFIGFTSCFVDYITVLSLWSNHFSYMLEYFHVLLYCNIVKTTPPRPFFVIMWGWSYYTIKLDFVDNCSLTFTIYWQEYQNDTHLITLTHI